MEITTKELSYSIGAKKIVDSLDFHVKKKQFVGIIGANGCGKSSFLKCICQGAKYTGDIFFDAQNMKDIKVKERAQKIAVVSQHNYYQFDFSVEEIVLMGRSPYKKNLETDGPKDYQVVEDSLAQVGMLDFRYRNFNTLSGGEQQRVILARALAQQTPCIVLDEPTNHLDIKYQLQLLEIISKLDVTVVSAIHDLTLAFQYCDYIYAIKDGKVFTHGTTREVITPSHIKSLFDVHAVIQENPPSISFSLS